MITRVALTPKNFEREINRLHSHEFHNLAFMINLAPGEYKLNNPLTIPANSVIVGMAPRNDLIKIITSSINFLPGRSGLQNLTLEINNGNNIFNLQPASYGFIQNIKLSSNIGFITTNNSGQFDIINSFIEIISEGEKDVIYDFSTGAEANIVNSSLSVIFISPLKSITTIISSYQGNCRLNNIAINIKFKKNKSKADKNKNITIIFDGNLTVDRALINWIGTGSETFILGAESDSLQPIDSPLLTLSNIKINLSKYNMVYSNYGEVALNNIIWNNLNYTPRPYIKK